MKTPASPAVLLGLIGFSMVAAGQTTPPSSLYQVCNGYFALCTLATCGAPPAKGNPLQPTSFSCTKCAVLNGSSVATIPPACMTVTAQPKGGDAIQSRFAMPNNLHLVTCANSNVWANCLDAKCTVDKDNPNYATCTCLPQTSSSYVWGTNGTTITPGIPKGCTGNPVISSEDSAGASAIATFWKDQKLQPPTPPAKK